MSLLWTGMCRIYFDRCSDSQLFWSVDNGDVLDATIHGGTDEGHDKDRSGRSPPAYDDAEACD